MDSGEIDGGSLGNFVARYERLRGEIKALNEDCGEVLKEAESAGFDKKIMKRLLQRRRMSKAQRDEEDTLLELYEHALSNFDHTPLGDAAARMRKSIVNGTLDVKLGNEPWMSEQIAADSYAAGKAEALEGFNETRNPFKHPSVESADWLRGHAEGEQERVAAFTAAQRRSVRPANGPDPETNG